jgi:hypothetical protein
VVGAFAAGVAQVQVYSSITFLEATQSLSKSLRYPSDRWVPQKPYRGLSPPNFDLPPALASTVSYR